MPPDSICYFSDPCSIEHLSPRDAGIPHLAQCAYHHQYCEPKATATVILTGAPAVIQSTLQYISRIFNYIFQLYIRRKQTPSLLIIQLARLVNILNVTNKLRANVVYRCKLVNLRSSRFATSKLDYAHQVDILRI